MTIASLRWIRWLSLPVLLVVLAYGIDQLSARPQEPAQQPPKTRLEEEEEPQPRAPRKVPIPLDDDAPVQPRPDPAPQSPEPFSIPVEAQRATHPILREMFRKLAVPHDLLIPHNGAPVRVGLIPWRTLPIGQPFDYLELTIDGRAGVQKTTTPEKIRAIQSYEELIALEVEKLLQGKWENHPPTAKVYLAKVDQLIWAEKSLRFALRFHDAAVRDRKRLGKEWDALRQKLQTRLKNVQRDLLRQLSEAANWEQANELAYHLGSAYADDDQMQQEIHRIQLLRKHLDARNESDKDLIDLNNALKNYLKRFAVDTQDPLVQQIRQRLVDQAEQRLKAISKLPENERANASVLLSTAQSIAPIELKTARELSGRLKLGYPVLIVGVPRLPERMTPATAWADSERMAVDLVFQSLLSSSDDPHLGRRYFPQLAEEMPRIVPLGREFVLPKSIRWTPPQLSDSVANLPETFLDARDVRGTLERMRESPDRWTAEILDLIDSIELKDPYRFRLSFKQGIADPLSLAEFKILPTRLLEDTQKIDDDRFARTPFGSGPFVYAGRETIANPNGNTPWSTVIFRMNPNLPRPVGSAYLREVRFLEVDPNSTDSTQPLDPLALFTATIAGSETSKYPEFVKLSLLTDVPGKRLARYRAHVAGRAPSWTTYSLPAPRRIWYLAVNHRRPHLQNRDFRYGMAHAIERDAILDACFRLSPGQGDRALRGPFPTDSWAEPTKERFQAEPAKARAFLGGYTQARGPIRISLKYPLDFPLPANAPLQEDQLPPVELAMRRLKQQIEAVTSIAQGQPPALEIQLQPLPWRDFHRQVHIEQNFDLAYDYFDYRNDLFWLHPLLDPNAAKLGGRNYMGYLAEGTSFEEKDRRLLQTMTEVRSHRDFKTHLLPKMHELHRSFIDRMPFIPLWQLQHHIVIHNAVDLRANERGVPLPATQLDPTRLLATVEHWRLR